MIDHYLNKYMALPVQVRASLWFLICSFLQKGISVLTTPIFTRLLSTTEYGSYSVWNSWLGIITVFVSLNLYYGVFTSGLVRNDQDRKQFSASIISLNMLSCLAWTILFLITGNFWCGLFDLSRLQMICMMIMIWTTSIFRFWSAEQRVDFKYKSLVAVTVAMSIAKPALGILLVAVSKDKVTARILGLCIVELVLCLPIFFAIISNNGRIISNKYWKYALTFNIPLIPHYLSQVILSSSDRIMIGRMVGDAEAGIYNLAYSIALMMTMFNTALMQTIEPWMYKKIKEGKAIEIKSIAYLCFIGIAAINIGLIYLAPELVGIFAPKSYSEAAILIPPIAMSVFFMFLYTFFAVVEFYYKETKLISAATLIGAVSNLIGNFVFIKIFGYRAAAYTTLSCYILYALFHYIFMRKLCKRHFGYQIYDLKTLCLIIVVFVGTGFLGLLLYSNFVIRYVVIVVMAIVFIIRRRTIIHMFKRIMAMRKG